MSLKSPLTPSYFMFIDESGVAHLNNLGRHFVMSTVVIHREDFKIIEGYLRLYKRRYFADDFKPLHATDICEKPYMKYRKLVKPKNVYHAFFEDFGHIIRNIPVRTCVYYVDKDKVRKKYSYSPGRGRKPAGIDTERPYEICAQEAIKDYAYFLNSEKATGEIVVESRLKSDAKFIAYFDSLRTAYETGKPPNPHYKVVKDSIPSIFISNKNAGNSGLELADMVAYFAYRHKAGDPFNNMKVPQHIVDKTFHAIKKCAPKGTNFIKIPKL